MKDEWHPLADGMEIRALATVTCPIWPFGVLRLPFSALRTGSGTNSNYCVRILTGGVGGNGRPAKLSARDGPPFPIWITPTGATSSSTTGNTARSRWCRRTGTAIWTLCSVPRRATPTFDGFIASGQTNRTVTRHAPRDEANLRGGTFRARLVMSTTADTEHRLATSLVDSGRHRIQPPVDLNRGRWGVEEMYGASKSVIERFHAKSTRGVRQDLHAAFTLPTLTRRFFNLCDGDPTGGGRSACPPCGPNCAMVCAVSETRSGR